MNNNNRFKKPTYFQTKLFINNQFVDGVKKTYIPVYNPATEEKICEISEGTEQDIELAIDAAAQAFKKWKKVAAAERSRLMMVLADLLEKHLDEFVALESLDNGKPLDQALFDIQEVVTSIRYYAGWADKLTGKTYQSSEDTLFYSRREPFGVVGLISPWNYPLMMCEWKFGPALATGNCIVHKPSEETPLTILRFAELIKEAGFPPGVFNIVPGYGNIAGEALARSQKVGKISFTGSTAVGRKILQASSETNLKKVALELGGKSPVIVCPSADLDKTIVAIWFAFTQNMGQSCDAGSRLLIHESIYDECLKRLIKMNESVIIGDAFDGANHGPQVNKIQFQRILQFIEETKNLKDVRVILGGERWGQKGYFIKPTIFANVDDNARIAQEEIFGPVLAVLKPWKTIEEVIERANNSSYGLACGIMSSNLTECELLAKEIDAGNVYINSYAISQRYMPFGGYKQSGFGRDGGEEGLLEYTQVKSVYYQL
ncbi:hypothetical protein IMG5_106650 [Ichthyophthirius multifiliis]|uniref:Aldehyde dehydrogenase domain-containing protein n=1 Tax=Ichthyophthirius multifiliis TaxID=5932 RepID=G0QT78_ICHMU|nr:hypothetical protein IMG5_106650 [Ichthyophthirius multifiliis]EGR31572.1 hypothetical protein IMG5_106650 [Ichthyophthirius multifiliis]|eukprot:XP_004035058.1 hypothetical protein IMG5_106650 [Ichthyophthirius multifiliis]